MNEPKLGLTSGLLNLSKRAKEEEALSSLDLNSKFAPIFNEMVAWIVFGCWLLLAMIFGVALYMRLPIRAEAEAHLIGLLNNLLSAATVYLLVFLVLRKGKEMLRSDAIRTEVLNPICSHVEAHSGRVLVAIKETCEIVRPRIRDIDWAALFDRAGEIQFVVQGWDKWARRVSEHLPEFLEKGGKISVVLHDPSQDMLLNAMARRMGRSIEQVKLEINDTIRQLKIATAKHPKQLSYCYTRELNWYCGIYFKSSTCEKHGKLLLSLYQHQPTGELMLNRVPSFIIRTDVFPDVGEWFDNEWKILQEESSR